jgi:hypothetical protein
MTEAITARGDCDGSYNGDNNNESCGSCDDSCDDCECLDDHDS